MLFRSLLSAVLFGCSHADPPVLPEEIPEVAEPDGFGAPVGPLSARIEPAAPTTDEGAVVTFRITLKNNGSTRNTVFLPDMNDPTAWMVRWSPLGLVDPKNTDVGYGNLADVGASKEPKPFRLALEPFDQKSFEVFVGGAWDGWSSYGKERATGRLWAAPCRFPKPGRYRVFAIYAPSHADQPQLENLPGWGVETNRVEIRILPKP